MFGDRYFSARYFGNRYFGPGSGDLSATDFDGHDGKPLDDNAPDSWDEHRQHRATLRETIAKAKRRANGEVEPEAEQVEEPQVDQPILSKPDYAAMIAALVADARPKPVVPPPAPAGQDDDELMAVFLLAA